MIYHETNPQPSDPIYKKNVRSAGYFAWKNENPTCFLILNQSSIANPNHTGCDTGKMQCHNQSSHHELIEI
ncbi:MAG: hypothetical protein COA78_09670 [Blastopirellula sp.]|nr:MAG: hypothetical protein COA78_09670 [Blastopirellula sp.]